MSSLPLPLCLSDFLSALPFPPLLFLTPFPVPSIAYFVVGSLYTVSGLLIYLLQRHSPPAITAEEAQAAARSAATRAERDDAQDETALIAPIFFSAAAVAPETKSKRKT